MQPLHVGFPASIILRRHITVLIGKLLGITIFWLLSITVSSLVVNFLPAIVATVLAAGSAGVVVVEWRTFTVTIRYDRILVRRLRFVVIEEVIYPIPGLHGLSRRQSFAGSLIDAGTLTITLPDRSIRLSLLTPFSAAACALGFDR